MTKRKRIAENYKENASPLSLLQEVASLQQELAQLRSENVTLQSTVTRLRREVSHALLCHKTALNENHRHEEIFERIRQELMNVKGGSEN